MHQIRFRLGLCPIWTPRGELITLPQKLKFSGHTFERKEKETTKSPEMREKKKCEGKRQTEKRRRKGEKKKGKGKGME